MKTTRLTPYILVSCLIHAGVLIGAHEFLKLPAEELEPVDLIPVEMVVVSKDSPALQPEFAPDDRIWPKKVFQTKSRIVMETMSDRSVDDITTPTPKADGFEPIVTIAGRATTVFITELPAFENTDSKPLPQISQILPSPISPVAPTTPTESVLLEVRVPAVLVETEAKLTPTDSQKPQRVAGPMPGIPTVAEPLFEPPLLATKSIDEPRMNVDMALTRSYIPAVRIGESVAGKPLILASQTYPLEVSPIYPTAPADFAQLEVKIPAVIVEAKSKLTLADFQTPQKIETPLASRRPRKDLAAEHPPIPREGTDEPAMIVSTLQLQSQPNGAQVYVNGMLIGETPLAWELPLGKHEVRLALPDYYDWKAQIELTERNKALPIFFRLLPVE